MTIKVKKTYIVLFFILLGSFLYFYSKQVANSKISTPEFANSATAEESKIHFQTSHSDPSSRRTPIVTAIEKTSSVVVNISTEKIVKQRNPFSNFGRDFFNDDFFNHFFDSFPETTYTQQTLGSGCIIDPKGYILTNEHVILRASKIKVISPNNQEYEARLVGADSRIDLAIIKIDADKKLPIAQIGDSDSLMIGETVIAIGNPFGLEHTVTTGVVSAVNRSIKIDEEKVYSDFIQTDASINPGNSGGPLININGEVVGINTAIYPQGEGIGFAIPINKAKLAISDLVNYGEVKKAWLGIKVQGLTRELASQFGVNGANGILIADVIAKSPADKAGLQRGDIIIEINSTPVRNTGDYHSKIGTVITGEKLDFSILRNNKTKKIRIIPENIPKSYGKDLSEKWLGAVIKSIGMMEVHKYGLKTKDGVVITQIKDGSLADNIKLEEGDIIRQLGAKEIHNIDDFYEAVVSAMDRESVIIAIQRGDFIYYATLES